MVRGIDCASKLNALTAAGVKAAGFAFAGRYLVPNVGSLAWKALTKNEAEIITNAGLRLLTIWETTASRVKGGAQAGREDGAKAYEVAKEIDMPAGGIIYFAVDYDAQVSEFRTIEDYLRAARTQTGEYEIGVYGSYTVIEEMVAQSVCKAFWQCCAWSAGRKSQHLNVYQGEFGKAVAGVPVDINDCDDMDAAGIWTYPNNSMAENRPSAAYATDTIGHASNNENGGGYGGAAGDQTGKEVCIRNWYNGSWNKVLRAKSPAVREKLACACEAACNNPNIGYDMGERNTLWDLGPSVGWDFSKITTPCETDCSALMQACAKAAGVDVARLNMGGGKWNSQVTSTMCDAYAATGAFDVLTDKMYMVSPDYLLRGDILVRESGHTAMSLTTGSKVEAECMEDDEMLSYEQWKEYQQKYRQELQDNDAGDWSAEARQWAVNVGMISGIGTDHDGNQNFAWADQLTREQAAALFYRFARMLGKA